MLIKISSEQPFQIMASAFIIGASQSGYTLQFSADGTNYSDLFSVGAGVERMVTNVAANAYYKLRGNTSEVSVNYGKDCGGGGGEGAGVSSINGKSGAVVLANINGKDLTSIGDQTVVQGITSGDKSATIDSNGRAFLRTINGQSLAGDTDIKIEGGSGDYSVVTELPEATKDGQMVYLSEDMTHEEPVTGVGGKSMQFGETGEGEYHIIQYGDADFRIHRNGDGEIYRVVSRGQDLPFSLDRTWYKLPKSFTNRKDAFYMFSNDGWFWFYTYQGEDFAINTYGSQDYAAGEACDYVDTVIDYEKGQYIVKDVDGTLSWEKYDFPAKVFVYDGNADHSEIANAVKPYFEALRTGGADAVNQMPHIYTIIYNGVPFSGFRSEGDDDHLVLYSSVMVGWASGIGNHKLYVWENGYCEWQDTGMHIEKPVYVSKEGFEGFDNATKITFKFNDGFEWGNVLAGKVYIDGWDRDLYIRPANYGEEHRIDVSVQDWFGKDSICDPNCEYCDNGKLIKYETNGYSIYWVAYANLEARTMTIYMKSSHTEDFGFTPDEGLQGQIDANHIEVSVEGGASLATVPTELSYVVEGTSKKVILPTGSEPVIIKIYSGWDVETQTYTYSTDTTADEVREAIKKRNALVYLVNEDNYMQANMYQGDYVIVQLGVGQIMINVSDNSVAVFADDPGSPVTSDSSVEKIIKLTQEEYDALEEKNEMTLYIIVG